jgi:hypothetical protein
VSVAQRVLARRRSGEQGGSVYVEFVLVAAFLLVPLILGLLSIGFALSRSLQVAQITRDVGRMVVRGVDFSEQANQDFLTGSTSRPTLPALARGLGMEGNGGNATGGTTGQGVMILSTYTRVATTCHCNNSGLIVLVRRIVIGNKGLFTSAYGSPASNIVNAQTGVIGDYSNQTSARAANFSNIINLGSEDLAYLVESKFNYPDLSYPGLLRNLGVYWYSVF